MSLFSKTTLFLLASLLVVASCNQTTKPVSLPGSSEDAARLKEIYPHSEEFAKKTHAKYYRSDKYYCLSCHGSNLEGGTAKVSCSKCHQSYPHPEGWSFHSAHGQAFAKSDTQGRSQCLMCHEKSKGEAKWSCATCHAAYPHKESFLKGEGHEYSTDLSQKPEGKCTLCHTDPMRFVRKEVYENGCNDCHENQTLKVLWQDNQAPGRNPDSFKQKKKKK